MIDGPPQPTDRYYLSDEDAYLVSKLLNDAGMRVHNPNPAARYYPLPQHNEVSAVAVVKTPLAGIPAMWPMCGTGTGTGSEAAADAAGVIGTGTGSQIYGGERPGFATCELVYLNGVTPSGRPLNRPRLYRIGSGDPVVWNPSFDAIPGNVYLVVVRDSFGAWWPINLKQTGSGGSSLSTIYTELASDVTLTLSTATLVMSIDLTPGTWSVSVSVYVASSDTFASVFQRQVWTSAGFGGGTPHVIHGPRSWLSYAAGSNTPPGGLGGYTVDNGSITFLAVVADDPAFPPPHTLSVYCTPLGFTNAPLAKQLQNAVDSSSIATGMTAVKVG